MRNGSNNNESKTMTETLKNVGMIGILFWWIWVPTLPIFMVIFGS